MCLINIEIDDEISQSNSILVKNVIHEVFKEVKLEFEVYDLEITFIYHKEIPPHLAQIIEKHSFHPIDLVKIGNLSGKLIPLNYKKLENNSISYFIILYPVPFIELEYPRTKRTLYHSLSNLVYHELLHLVIIEREILTLSLKQFRRNMKYQEIPNLVEKYIIEEYFVKYLLLVRIFGKFPKLYDPFLWSKVKDEVLRLLYVERASLMKQIETKAELNLIRYSFISYLGYLDCVFAQHQAASLSGSYLAVGDFLFDFLFQKNDGLDILKQYADDSNLVSCLLDEIMIKPNYKNELLLKFTDRKSVV